MDAVSYNRRDETEHYSQAGHLYRLMHADQQSKLIANLVGALNKVPRFIRVRQMGHFYRADPGCSADVALEPVLR